MKLTLVYNNPIFIIEEWDCEVNVAALPFSDNSVLKKRQKYAAKVFFAALFLLFRNNFVEQWNHSRIDSFLDSMYNETRFLYTKFTRRNAR